MLNLLTYWKDVQRNVGYSSLPDPLWDSLIGTACINLKTQQVSISPEFIKELQKSGLSEETAVKAMLEHELEHHLTHPYDLETLLLSMDALRSYKHAENIEALFSDIKINLTAVLKGRGDHILDAVDATYKEKLMTTVNAYLHESLGGKPVTPGHPELLEKLANVNFLSVNRKETLLALQYFAHILTPYLDELPDNNEYSSGDFSEEDIRKTVKRAQLNGRCSSAAAERILNANNISTDLWERYLQEATKYPVRVEPIPLTENAGMYPYEHKEWSLDQPLETIDPYSSFGLLVPGITQRWKYAEHETYGVQEGWADTVLALDTSGSMDRFAEYSAALVVTLAIAKSYMLNQAKVAGVNFSDNTIWTPATQNIEEFAKFMTKDQCGGTTLEIEKLAAAYETCKKPVDVHIITDTEICNITSVLEYLRGVEGRPNIWIIGGKGSYPGIACHPVSHPRDIFKAVIR